MTDISHTTIHRYDPMWKNKFETEAITLKNIFGDEALAVEHIGSTSVDGLASKPIVDIAVLINSYLEADKFIEPLTKIGYWYDKENSSGERHLFRKGKPTEFHLSIAYADRGDFWERQLLFRDYLRTHPEALREYAQLKEDLIKNDPTGGDKYISGKTDFIQRILTKA